MAKSNTPLSKIKILATEIAARDLYVQAANKAGIRTVLHVYGEKYSALKKDVGIILDRHACPGDMILSWDNVWHRPASNW